MLFSDLNIIVNGVAYPAHKLIFYDFDYFKPLLCPDSAWNTSEIILDDINHEAWDTLYKLVYKCKDFFNESVDRCNDRVDEYPYYNVIDHTCSILNKLTIEQIKDICILADYLCMERYQNFLQCYLYSLYGHVGDHNKSSEKSDTSDEECDPGKSILYTSKDSFNWIWQSSVDLFNLCIKCDKNHLTIEDLEGLVNLFCSFEHRLDIAYKILMSAIYDKLNVEQKEKITLHIMDYGYKLPKNLARKLAVEHPQLISMNFIIENKMFRFVGEYSDKLLKTQFDFDDFYMLVDYILIRNEYTDFEAIYAASVIIENIPDVTSYTIHCLAQHIVLNKNYPKTLERLVSCMKEEHKIYY